jgi:hypothetical protein
MFLKKPSREYLKDAKNQWFNLTDKVKTGTKHLSDMVTSKTRHFLVKNKQSKNEIKTQTHSTKEIQKNARSDKPLIKGNLDLRRVWSHSKRAVEGSKAGEILTKMFEKPWARKTAFAAAAIGALALVEKTVTGFMPEPAIPKHYERGYDVMKETMTDFGSPVDLQKTASKTITPYHSSTRRSITTTVKTLTDKNIALFSSKHAINHTRY